MELWLVIIPGRHIGPYVYSLKKNRGNILVTIMGMSAVLRVIVSGYPRKPIPS